MPKVLLADDSTHAQRMGSRILAGEGIEVVTVSNGEAAVKRLTKDEFDVVLADIFMPGRSGYEVCSYIKNSSQFRHVPVVLLVGHLEPYDSDQGKQVQADAILKKPFEPSEMVRTVRSLIETARKQKPAPAPAPAPEPAPAAEPAPAFEPEPQIVSTTRATAALEVPPELQDSAIPFLDESVVPQPAAQAAPPQFATAAPQPFEQQVVEHAPAAAAPVETPAEAEAVAEPAAVEHEIVLEPPVIDLGSPEAPQAETEAVAFPDLAAAEAQAAPEDLVPAGAAPGAFQFEIPHEAAPPTPRMKWVAQAEAVTDADRALFAPSAIPVTAAAETAAVASVSAAATAVETAEPAAAAPAEVAAVAAVAVEPAPAQEVPDWADLLKSIQEPPAEAPQEAAVQALPKAPGAVAVEPAAPAISSVAVEEAPPAAEPAAAEEGIAAEAAVAAPEEAAPEPAAAVEAPAPEEEPAAAEAPVEAQAPEALEAPAAQITEPEVTPQEALSPRPVLDPAALRAAIESGFDRVLPGLKVVPGLIDTIADEILRRFGGA